MYEITAVQIWNEWWHKPNASYNGMQQSLPTPSPIRAIRKYWFTMPQSPFQLLNNSHVHPLNFIREHPAASTCERRELAESKTRMLRENAAKETYRL